MHMGGGMLGADPSQLRGASFDGAVVRRVLRFARPYRRQLLAYLGIIVAVALVQLIPPLIFRQIIDEAIPRGIDQGDRGLLHLLAGLAILAAVGSGALAIVDRWLSSRIGEGVIYDLRVRVFDHVQRMPISFFTRTQTGALTNRLNSDVIGAQIGGAVKNVVAIAAGVSSPVKARSLAPRCVARAQRIALVAPVPTAITLSPGATPARQ